MALGLRPYLVWVSLGVPNPGHTLVQEAPLSSASKQYHQHQQKLQDLKT